MGSTLLSEGLQATPMDLMMAHLSRWMLLLKDKQRINTKQVNKQIEGIKIELLSSKTFLSIEHVVYIFFRAHLSLCPKIYCSLSKTTPTLPNCCPLMRECCLECLASRCHLRFIEGLTHFLTSWYDFDPRWARMAFLCSNLHNNRVNNAPKT